MERKDKEISKTSPNFPYSIVLSMKITIGGLQITIKWDVVIIGGELAGDCCELFS
jgi:hypothetical protein